MSSQIKDICQSVQVEQLKSIRDLTSGHLNENHLYYPRPTINGVRKPTWTSSQKSCPTLRPPHRLTTHSTHVEQMKESLIDFTYLTLPESPRKKPLSSRRSESNENSPRISLSKEPLPPIPRQERVQVPSFSIDLSDKEKLRKMKHFNENVLQKSDTHLHGLGYSEDFVAFVEDNLRLKLLTIESQTKRQTLSLNRLQAYSEAFIDLIEGSPAFGILLERIKDEYDLYLEHLLATQPEFGIHVAEQLKRLRQAQPNFSAADAELFDIERIEKQTRDALETNRQLHEELRRIKQQQIEQRAADEIRLINVPTGPTEIRIKTQAEQIDDMREFVFDLLDRMTQKKNELNEKFVPLSICTQIQQAIRDTEMDIIKTKKQNETLINELIHLEEKIRKRIVFHDQSEFAEENVRQILDLLKKIDLLHLNKNDVRHEKDFVVNEDDRYFLHTYNDYFS